MSTNHTGLDHIASDLFFEKQRLQECLKALEQVVLRPEWIQTLGRDSMSKVQDELDLLFEVATRIDDVRRSLVKNLAETTSVDIEAFLSELGSACEGVLKGRGLHTKLERHIKLAAFDPSRLADLAHVLRDVFATFCEFSIDGLKERQLRGKGSQVKIVVRWVPHEYGVRLSVLASGNGLPPPLQVEHGARLAKLGVRAHFQGKLGHWSSWTFYICPLSGPLRCVPVLAGGHWYYVPSWALMRSEFEGKVADGGNFDLSTWKACHPKKSDKSLTLSVGMGISRLFVESFGDEKDVFVRPVPLIYAYGGRYLGMAVDTGGERSQGGTLSSLLPVLDPSYIIYRLKGHSGVSV